MSETVTETAPEAPAEFFPTNVASVLHEIVDAIPLRHEWENTRLHNAVANLDKDPATILAVTDPRAPTQGADNPQIAAMQAEIAQLSELVRTLAADKAGTTPETTPVETPAPAPATGSDLSGA